MFARDGFLDDGSAAGDFEPSLEDRRRRGGDRRGGDFDGSFSSSGNRLECARAIFSAFRPLRLLFPPKMRQLSN